MGELKRPISRIAYRHIPNRTWIEEIIRIYPK
jgi:hypothetical protein